MKLFTNKYPILGMLTINKDNNVDKDSISIEFKEGKIFKMIGFCFDDLVLECEGKAIMVKASVFQLVFTETELDF